MPTILCRTMLRNAQILNDGLRLNINKGRGISPNRFTISSFKTLPCSVLSRCHFHGNPGAVSNESQREIKSFPVLKELLKTIWPKDNLPTRRRVMASVALLISAKVSNVLVPFMMKYTVEALTDHAVIEDLTTSQLLATGPAICILSYGAMRLASVGFNELKNAIFAKVAQENIRKTQLEAFNHIHELDLKFHLSRKTGMIAKVLDRGTSFILGTLIFNWIPTLFEIALVTGIMAVKCGFPFAFTAVCCISTYTLFTLALTRWRIKYRLEMNNCDNEAGSKTIDSLMNYETVKYFNNEKHESERLNEILEKYEKASLKTATSLAVLNFGQSSIFSLSLVGMMLLASQNILSGTMTIGDLVMVNGLLFQLSVPLYFLGSLYRDIKESLVNLSNLFDIMKQEKNVKELEDVKNLVLEPYKTAEKDTFENFIEFDKVTFGYVHEKEILKNVTIKIPFGKKIAIVGGSGSGKSTIARLLYRFYDPQDGTISINGQDIKTTSLNSLRSSISVVPQDQILFHDSIYYNILYGNIKATKDQVYNAAKMAGLHEVIMKFPHKYETQVGERGLKLSGGEKQRVAIARAILKDSPIFIYDEATSSLDSLLEKKILHSIDNIMKMKTSIVIAHRLSTITDAHCIYVLKDGNVKEKGSHLELLSDPLSLYSVLWRKQNDTVYRKQPERSAQMEEGMVDKYTDFDPDQVCGIMEKCCRR